MGSAPAWSRPLRSLPLTALPGESGCLSWKLGPPRPSPRGNAPSISQPHLSGAVSKLRSQEAGTSFPSAASLLSKARFQRVGWGGAALGLDETPSTTAGQTPQAPSQLQAWPLATDTPGKPKQPAQGGRWPRGLKPPLCHSRSPVDTMSPNPPSAYLPPPMCPDLCVWGPQVAERSQSWVPRGSTERQAPSLLPCGLRTPPPPGSDPLFLRTKGSRQSLRVLLTPHPLPEQDKGVGCKGSDASASFCGGYKGREAG